MGCPLRVRLAYRPNEPLLVAHVGKGKRVATLEVTVAYLDCNAPSFESGSEGKG